jgi:hypothetical protein
LLKEQQKQRAMQQQMLQQQYSMHNMYPNSPMTMGPQQIAGANNPNWQMNNMNQMMAPGIIPQNAINGMGVPQPVIHTLHTYVKKYYS